MNQQQLDRIEKKLDLLVQMLNQQTHYIGHALQYMKTELGSPDATLKELKPDLDYHHHYQKAALDALNDLLTQFSSLQPEVSPEVPMIGGLRAHREMRGLKQEEVAEAVGVTAIQISRWETGARQVSLEDAFRLAAFYQTTVNELVSEWGVK